MATIAPATALCIHTIRAKLPPAAFQPAPQRLWHVAIHATIIAAGYAGLRAYPAVGLLWSIVIGHSLACAAFVAHEISHNAVVRNRPIKYLLELLIFGLNVLPPTMWNRLHNDAHHGHANTPTDPDRPYLESERTRATGWYTAWLYPSDEIWPGNILVLAHFVSYITRNVASVFYRADRKPAIITHKPAYRPAERRGVAVELVVIAWMQYGVYVAVGRSMSAYLWASPIALVVTSAVIMAYVFTNHFLNPISQTHDPLSGTTSVQVPAWVDRVHSHFSYHTEHHLFPALNSDFYPAVSAALKDTAPETYHQLPIVEAWRRLWAQPRYRALR